MVDALVWFLTIQLLGVVALPLTFTLFCRLPDRGYTLTKPLALVLYSYILWLLGMTHLLPNSQATIIAILVLGGVASGLVLWRQWANIWTFLRAERQMLLIAEAVFLGFFLLWLAMISQVPGISHTEKPMDFGFMNAILQSRYFPPEDPWLAGHSISYYYFGHFMMAFLTKLTAVPSSVGYNLALASIPALVGIGSFGLLYNLVRLSGGGRVPAIGFGLVAPVLVIVIGNLEGALEFVHLRGWGGDGFWDWVGIKGLESGVPIGSGVFPDDYNWGWRASRVIDTLEGGRSLDFTITEFPFFSFMLGDLHAHVMSLPFVLLTLALVLNLFLLPDPPGLSWLRHNWWELAAVALFLGALAFINLWDLPVLAAVLGAVLLVKSYGHEKGDLPKAAGNAALVFVPVVVMAVVLFLPFYLTLGGQVSGISRLGDVSTRPFLFFVAIGLLFLLGASFLIRQLPGLVRPAWVDAHAILLLLVVTLTPFFLWVAIHLLLSPFDDGVIYAFTDVGGRFLWILPGLAIVGLAGFSVAQRVRLNREPVVGFPLLLLGVAVYLLVGVELFHVVDLLPRRMNTVFKVYYQAWLLLAVVGAYGLYYWHSHRPAVGPASSRRRWIGLRLGHYAWTGVVGVLLVASLYYPVGAVLDTTGVLGRGYTPEGNTLDGLAFLRSSASGEYAAIGWLRDEAPWGRIVEAVGNDYSDYGRISASTGLPTILGWKGHELQWRGTSAPYAGREDDVSQIYRSDDAEVVRHLLERYDVRYVYLGRRERTTYGSSRLSKFGGFMRIAFEQDDVIIYERLEGSKTGVRIGDDPGP